MTATTVSTGSQVAGCLIRFFAPEYTSVKLKVGGDFQVFTITEEYSMYLRRFDPLYLPMSGDPITLLLDSETSQVTGIYSSRMASAKKKKPVEYAAVSDFFGKNAKGSEVLSTNVSETVPGQDAMSIASAEPVSIKAPQPGSISATLAAEPTSFLPDKETLTSYLDMFSQLGLTGSDSESTAAYLFSLLRAITIYQRTGSSDAISLSKISEDMQSIRKTLFSVVADTPFQTTKQDSTDAEPLVPKLRLPVAELPAYTGDRVVLTADFESKERLQEPETPVAAPELAHNHDFDYHRVHGAVDETKNPRDLQKKLCFSLGYDGDQIFQQIDAESGIVTESPLRPLPEEPTPVATDGTSGLEARLQQVSLTDVLTAAETPFVTGAEARDTDRSSHEASSTCAPETTTAPPDVVTVESSRRTPTPAPSFNSTRQRLASLL